VDYLPHLPAPFSAVKRGLVAFRVRKQWPTQAAARGAGDRRRPPLSAPRREGLRWRGALWALELGWHPTVAPVRGPLKTDLVLFGFNPPPPTGVTVGYYPMGGPGPSGYDVRHRNPYLVVEPA
jgi:hypothetical protein